MIPYDEILYSGQFNFFIITGRIFHCKPSSWYAVTFDKNKSVETFRELSGEELNEVQKR